jgi:hypothetical protein
MPSLLSSTGSVRYAEISSVSVSEILYVHGQINAEVLFTLLANFKVGCPSLMHVMTPT